MRRPCGLTPQHHRPRPPLPDSSGGKGKLDILVATPVASSRRSREHHRGNFDKTFDLNARAALFTAQKALHSCTTVGRSSWSARSPATRAINGYSTYSATKAAVRSYARTWTQEFKDRGIRINTLSPGPIDTPIMDGQADSKEGADAIRAASPSVIPLARMGQPEEVAAAAYFLASDESSFVTASTSPSTAAWPRSKSKSRPLKDSPMRTP